MSTVSEENVRLVGVHHRGTRNHMGCECNWNASLPVMKVRQDSENVQVTVNGTGEVPCHLENDVIYRVKRLSSPVLPEGEVREIQSLLMPIVQDAGHSVDSLLSLNYELPKEASFAKEMRRQLYKSLKVKVPDETLSLIGTIARRYQESCEEEYVFSLTREYDRPDRFYLNGGSCYWSGDGFHSKSMCHCKQLGVSLLVKLPLSCQDSNLERFYSNWNYYSDGTYPLIRSLVIPVEYAKGAREYHLVPDWEYKQLSRFVVLNSYDRSDAWRDEHYSNLDVHMSKLLSGVLENASCGGNAKGGSMNHRFYMNSFAGRGSIPIIHIGREIPPNSYPLTPRCSEVKTCW